MYCGFYYCNKTAEMLCRDCQTSNILCNSHGSSHFQESGHQVEVTNPEVLNSVFTETLRTEIEKCSEKIIEETQELISMITKISSIALNLLKERSKGITKLNQLKVIKLDDERFKSLKSGACCILADLEKKNEIHMKSNIEIMLEMKKMDTDTKKNFFQERYAINLSNQGTQEIILSNDGCYLFQCYVFLGKNLQDCILKKDSEK